MAKIGAHNAEIKLKTKEETRSLHPNYKFDTLKSFSKTAFSPALVQEQRRFPPLRPMPRPPQLQQEDDGSARIRIYNKNS